MPEASKTRSLILAAFLLVSCVFLFFRSCDDDGGYGQRTAYARSQ